jgi:hypothetical protein
MKFIVIILRLSTTNLSASWSAQTTKRYGSGRRKLTGYSEVQQPMQRTLYTTKVAVNFSHYIFHSCLRSKYVDYRVIYA